MWRRPPSASASRPGRSCRLCAQDAATPRMAARCRSRACWPARPATAPPSSTPERDAGRVAGTFKLVGQSTEKRGPAVAGETVAFAKLDHAKTGDTLSTGKQPHKPVAAGEAVRAGARDRGLRQGAQGRRQARPGAAQAARGGSLDHASCTMPRRRKWCCGARARCTCGSRPSGSASASASRS